MFYVLRQTCVIWSSVRVTSRPTMAPLAAVSRRPHVTVTDDVSPGTSVAGVDDMKISEPEG